MRGGLVLLTLLLLVGSENFVAAQSPVAAKVGDRSITFAELEALVRAQLRPLEEQMYAIRRRALEQFIVEEVLQAEAARVGVTPDELKKRLQSSATVTEAEVENALRQSPAAAGGMADLARETTRIQLLTRARIATLQQAVRELRAVAHVEILLPELPPERGDLQTAGFPTLGNTRAPVTIVEFADFQCPFCASMNPILHDIVRSSNDRVRLVHRDFPLPNHKQAWGAAEAARCAADQHKFWEFQERLFQRSSSLSEPVFQEIASELNLDANSFQRCMEDGRHSAAIRSDIEDGLRIGVRATPTFVVNGTILRGAVTKADLEKIIDAELNSNGRARNQHQEAR